DLRPTCGRTRDGAAGRIRELEQALDEAPSRDRLRELEAELVECQETLRDTQGWSKRHTAMATEATARAEKAEGDRNRVSRELVDLAKAYNAGIEEHRLVKLRL